MKLGQAVLQVRVALLGPRVWVAVGRKDHKDPLEFKDRVYSSVMVMANA